MNVILSGDREHDDILIVELLMLGLRAKYANLSVFEGEASGLDTLARVVGQAHHTSVRPFPPDWKRFGYGAGPRRNAEMLAAGAEMTFCFHDEIEMSKGTFNMAVQSTHGEKKTYLISKLSEERLAALKEWKEWKTMWWWIEGKKRLGSKKKGTRRTVWTPLYMAKSKEQAKSLLGVILNEMTSSKTEQRVLGEYIDFRIAPPKIEDNTTPKERRKLAKSGLVHKCPACSSTQLRKVKKGDERLWKCEDCKNRWPRGTKKAGEPSEIASKPSNGSGKGIATPKRPRKRQKAS